MRPKIEAFFDQRALLELEGRTQDELRLGVVVAFALQGAALAHIVSALSEVNPIEALIVVGSRLLAILRLLTFMSWRKFRRRALSLLFEVNGWGVSARLKLSRSLGRRFKRAPKLPRGTKVVGGDPADWKS
ncbi:MAG: hypothetical protein LBM75_07300 [Myxococcales bacterium]|nr:hypothetical protein [Myxococcales bacterium]